MVRGLWGAILGSKSFPGAKQWGFQEDQNSLPENRLPLSWEDDTQEKAGTSKRLLPGLPASTLSSEQSVLFSAEQPGWACKTYIRLQHSLKTIPQLPTTAGWSHHADRPGSSCVSPLTSVPACFLLAHCFPDAQALFFFHLIPFLPQSWHWAFPPPGSFSFQMLMNLTSLSY